MLDIKPWVAAFDVPGFDSGDVDLAQLRSGWLGQHWVLSRPEPAQSPPS